MYMYIYIYLCRGCFPGGNQRNRSRSNCRCRCDTFLPVHTALDFDTHQHLHSRFGCSHLTMWYTSVELTPAISPISFIPHHAVATVATITVVAVWICRTGILTLQTLIDIWEWEYYIFTWLSYAWDLISNLHRFVHSIYTHCDMYTSSFPQYWNIHEDHMHQSSIHIHWYLKIEITTDIYNHCCIIHWLVYLSRQSHFQYIHSYTHIHTFQQYWSS